MHFHLSTALATALRLVCFLLFIVQHIFQISLEIASLTRGLLRSMLPNFQVFRAFPLTFLLLVSSIKHYGRRMVHTLLIQNHFV